MAKKTIKTDNGSKDFDSLVRQIQTTSDILQQDARLVINRNVTTRAWLTGFYIVEYEQHGSDRAKYGENLLLNLSKRLDGKSFGLSSLKNYRQFYLYYPELVTPIVAFYNQRKINGLQKAKHRLAFSRLQMKAAKKKVRHCLTFLAILDKSHLSQRMALPYRLLMER